MTLPVSRRANARLSAAALFLYMSLIFISSSRPIPVPLRRYPDCLLHGAAYALLCLLAWFAARTWVPGLRPRMMLASPVLFSALYGVTDEFHQVFVPGRDASIADIACDATGALIMAGIIMAIVRCHSPGENDHDCVQPSSR